MAKVITTELQHSGASAANITLDSSKNVTAENNLQVDGNLTVTGTIPADKLTGALPAISGASLTGISSPTPGRNKIINGGMIINQRGNVTGKTTSSNSYFGPDRYQFKLTNNNAGTWSISQETDAPEGFSNSLLWHCTSGVTMSGSNNVYMRHKVEAQNLVDWKWGTSSAKDVILSFYVKSTETGTGTILAFHNDHDTSDANTGYTYTISAANTWERKTIQLVKSTTDAFDANNAAGLSLYFNMDGGPNLKTGTLNTSWAGWNEANWMVGQTIAMAGTGKKYWITGIQLEEGTTATDFEHRSYGDELERCKRYYQQFGQASGDGHIPIVTGYVRATNNVRAGYQFRPFMRAAPSISSNGTLRGYNGASLDINNGITMDSSNVQSAAVNHNGTGTFSTAGYGAIIDQGGNTANYVAFSAEL